ncbi:MAG: hypothetical protein ACTSRN_07925 [Alphaproteobacteria bacterium]
MFWIDDAYFTQHLDSAGANLLFAHIHMQLDDFFDLVVGGGLVLLRRLHIDIMTDLNAALGVSVRKMS